MKIATIYPDDEIVEIGDKITALSKEELVMLYKYLASLGIYPVMS